MSEAFEKFRSWKKAESLLKFTIAVKGEKTETVFGVITAIDEELLLVSFMIRGTRSFRTLDFHGATFSVATNLVVAEREGGFLKVEALSSENQPYGVH